jgi:sulfite reductase alpha subunit-like flavoprotein
MRHKKVYVQDLIEREAKLISQLLIEQGGYVFVCGDAKAMAPAVKQTFIDIFSTKLLSTNIEPKTSLENTRITATISNTNIGEDFMQKLKKDKRYVEDVWAS